MWCCVDQHRGYVVAGPAHKSGLLAKEVAVIMTRHRRTVFLVPRTACSDRRSHFTGGWFNAMCSLRRVVGRCHPTCPPAVSPTTIPCGRAGIHPPSMYPSALPPAPMPQHPRAGKATLGAQGGKGGELTRAWKRIGEEARRLQEREARPMGEAARAAGVRTRAQGSPRGGEAQAVEELQRAWADIRRRLEKVEMAGRDGKWPGQRARERGRPECRPPLQPFRRPGIPPEVEREVQERAWKRIRSEEARLEERDREVAERERRLQEEEEALARRGHQVIPDSEGDTPRTDTEGWSPSKKRARWEGGDGGHARGKHCRVEEQGARGATGAPQPARPRPEPTPTDWRSESLLPRHYA